MQDLALKTLRESVAQLGHQVAILSSGAASGGAGAGAVGNHRGTLPGTPTAASSQLQGSSSAQIESELAPLKASLAGLVGLPARMDALTAQASMSSSSTQPNGPSSATSDNYVHSCCTGGTRHELT
jgi:hypothetical protein